MSYAYKHNTHHAVKKFITALSLLVLASLPQTASADMGIWDDFFKPGAKWTLNNDSSRSSQHFARVVVTNYDIHTLGNAVVAKLRWVCIDSAGKEVGDCRFSFLPSQIALTAKGVFFLEATATDEKIIQAIKGQPTFVNPPKITNHGYGLHVIRSDWHRKQGKDVLCFYDSPPKNAPDCEDVCFSDMCLSKGHGIVSVSGNAMPNAESYCQKEFCMH